MPSLEMAWSRRGAPVRLCSPAPQVEKKEPMTMTQGEGQAKVPTTRLPFTASPNLERDSKRQRHWVSNAPGTPEWLDPDQCHAQQDADYRARLHSGQKQI